MSSKHPVALPDLPGLRSMSCKGAVLCRIQNVKRSVSIEFEFSMDAIRQYHSCGIEALTDRQADRRSGGRC